MHCIWFAVLGGVRAADEARFLNYGSFGVSKWHDSETSVDASAELLDIIFPGMISLQRLSEAGETSAGEASPSEGEHATRILGADLDIAGTELAVRHKGGLELSKLAWLHFPKAGTSFANTLVSWGCPKLSDQDLVNRESSDKSGAYIWGFMAQHGQQCDDGFRLCGGHTPIRPGDCTGWEQHRGHFVAMFRQPEQRLISGYNQNCHDAPGDKSNYTLTSYASAVAGCSVKMMNGHDCGAPVPISSDMVATAIQRLDRGFAFVGLTEQWALSVCLFHAMHGGSCHAREFLNVRPGKRHTAMRYDTSGLEGWVDPYDGALYARAATVFRNNLARFNVTPETCASDICSAASAAFETSFFAEQR